MGLIFTSVLVRRLLGPLGLSGPSISWTYSYSKQTYLEGIYNPPPAAHPLPPAHAPLPPPYSAICDITVIVKKLLKLHQCYSG